MKVTREGGGEREEDSHFWDWNSNFVVYWPYSPIIFCSLLTSFIDPLAYIPIYLYLYLLHLHFCVHIHCILCLYLYLYLLDVIVGPRAFMSCVSGHSRILLIWPLIIVKEQHIDLLVVLHNITSLLVLFGSWQRPSSLSYHELFEEGRDKFTHWSSFQWDFSLGCQSLWSGMLPHLEPKEGEKTFSWPIRSARTSVMDISGCPMAVIS